MNNAPALILSFLLFICASPVFSQDIVQDEEKIFLLEDFEPIGSRSLVECRQGKWQEDISEPAIHCTEWLIPETRNLKKTGVLRLTYKVNSATFAPCGYFLKFKEADLSDFTDLNLYVKGDRFDGFPDALEVQLCEGEHSVSQKIDGISSSWQKITIPLNGFKDQLGECKKIDTLRIVFSDCCLNSKKGILYIDDVFFSGSESMQQLVNDYINKGNSYCEEARYETAISEYKKALELDSDNVFIYTNLGVAYSKQQKYAQAAGEFEKAVQINPSYVPAHLRLAIIYDEHLFEKEKAAAHYEKFLKLDTSLDFERRAKIIQWIEEANETL